MLHREWKCSWSSADRRCSNCIWVINNFIIYWGVPYIRCLKVSLKWIDCVTTGLYYTMLCITWYNILLVFNTFPLSIQNTHLIACQWNKVLFFISSNLTHVLSHILFLTISHGAYTYIMMYVLWRWNVYALTRGLCRYLFPKFYSNKRNKHQNKTSNILLCMKILNFHIADVSYQTCAPTTLVPLWM